ncbi:MAG: Cation/multidrug efflux pump [Microgenomates group bacterium GW2011_GWA2_44_7]|nr:MAG: Cation/multidrug efflux pump [Microgenomates group bacterium GW2011_GWA2_44_7]
MPVRRNLSGGSRGSTYLRNLQFDPKLKNSFIAGYLTNLRVLILLVFVIAALGIASYISLPRNLIPDIRIPLVIVSTVLPGAGPNDIESLITVPLEDAIRQIANIQTIQSTSRESVSIITIQFNSGVDPDKARSDVQSAVDSVASLPSDKLPTNVQKLDFQNMPVWTFNLVSSGDLASLFRFSKSLKSNLENLPLVDHVSVSGQEEQEIQILIKPNVLNSYQINPMMLIPAIKNAIKALPAGSVSANDYTFNLTIDPAVVTIDDIRNLKLTVSGTQISFGDLFEISEKAKSNQPLALIKVGDKAPTRSVTFNVFRASGAKIDQTVAEAKEEVDKRLLAYKGQFTIYSVADTGEEIDTQFSHLQRDFLLTVFLVTAILFIFLGLRQALVASLTAPLVFFITFIIMAATGVSLSFISVFSLLLALGLLVDDTIVVISALTDYFRSGKFTPVQTGLLVWRDFLIPVLTTTATTVWAFIPIFITSGIIGEFIKPIPIVVSSTLIASIFIALFVTFPLVIFLLHPVFPKRVIVFGRAVLIIGLAVGIVAIVSQSDLLLVISFVLSVGLFILNVRRGVLDRLVLKIKTGLNWGGRFTRIKSTLINGMVSFHHISAIYKRIILAILNNPTHRRQTILMVAVFFIFTILLWPLGLVKNEFFPKTDQDVVYVAIEMPAGTSTQKANKELFEIFDRFNGLKETVFVSGNVGQSFSSAGFGVGAGEVNNLLFSVELLDQEERRQTSSQIAEAIRKAFDRYQNGKVSVEEVSGGPPVGADVQIKLFGGDLTILDQYANKLMDHLKSQPGTTNVDKSIKSGVGKIVFTPDDRKLTQLGIGRDSLGFWLRFYASGITADSLKLSEGGPDKTDINLRLNTGLPTVETLEGFSIPTQQGSYPLAALGKFNLAVSPTTIIREEGKRVVSVTASVKPGFSISTINQNLGQFADGLKLPEGYSWETGGANQENQKSVFSLLQAMGISVLLIVVTMIVQFNSFRRALIVILVIPLSISGVFLIFALSQTSLTFPALVGVLALFGIVVKNSILVVDKIVANQKAGIAFIESIADAAASRLEPIALTSLTAIFGLIPITLSDPIWRGLGGAIIAGLTFSGTIMLFFIPVVYYYFFVQSEK